MIYLVLLLFAICLARVQYLVSKFNIGSRWNGYGAIDGVLNKNSQAPMVYRVLVPWIIRKKELWRYELMQTSLIYVMLISIYLAWNFYILLMALVIFTVTLWYDYWDWTVELIGLSLALVSFPLAFLGTMIYALGRETAPLAGLVYALHSHDYLGGLLLSLIAILILLLVRKIQGKHSLYCKRFMIRENLELLKKGNTSAWLSIFIILLGMLELPQALSQNGHLDILIVPVVSILGLTMAKINETRVFVGVVPYAALFISGLIK